MCRPTLLSLLNRPAARRNDGSHSRNREELAFPELRRRAVPGRIPRGERGRQCAPCARRVVAGRGEDAGSFVTRRKSRYHEAMVNDSRARKRRWPGAPGCESPRVSQGSRRAAQPLCKLSDHCGELFIAESNQERNGSPQDGRVRQAASTPGVPRGWRTPRAGGAASPRAKRRVIRAGFEHAGAGIDAKVAQARRGCVSASDCRESCPWPSPTKQTRFAEREFRSKGRCGVARACRRQAATPSNGERPGELRSNRAVREGCVAPPATAWQGARDIHHAAAAIARRGVCENIRAGRRPSGRRRGVPQARLSMTKQRDDQQSRRSLEEHRAFGVQSISEARE